MLLMLRLTILALTNAVNERWVVWLTIKMFVVFISQGQSRSHLLQESGLGAS